jgi:hypothetical protein
LLTLRVPISVPRVPIIVLRVPISVPRVPIIVLRVPISVPRVPIIVLRVPISVPNVLITTALGTRPPPASIGCGPHTLLAVSSTAVPCRRSGSAPPAAEGSTGLRKRQAPCVFRSRCSTRSA